MSSLNKIISFVLNPTFSGWFLVVKIIFLIFGLIFLIGIIFFLFRTTWLKRLFFQDLTEFLTYRPYGVRRIAKIWLKIKARLDTGLEAEYKMAIIEADSLLDDILKRMGYSGETLRERLEQLTAATLPNIDQIRQAHQIRDNVVRDPDYRLTLDQAKRVLEIYEKALTDLQAL